ncbi:flagellar motor stator protein MotA [Hydrogenibacillus schlegelii]|uniref:Flagellar motor protein MotA n=1 Tax=Hydrogenibacillus schlegelii TaxID=1484 RepID=A0A132NE20_HYDSH|nr:MULTISPECIES: flagellar motor stator protein MotA [Hydrogenibacillus]KWX08348.1 flagellar motor protein MotA [Hydrogenibacillus schlegelii]MBT9283311.1 flagellar motor stator protein MotA [Hydrogenibacillus schlegelii]OAR03218.1 flagellar motor protein MotA [Hydrogenibacillus schlegelii]PTQ53716.1 MAG: Flagellar motor rotation protein MotA [Hydrogenibacillus schlegelii]QZA32018.1 flagellar motor stator protein MotA [Hydrogenibacillus sp. N12]
MERSTILGLILGLIAVGYGMVLKGAPLTSLFTNPAAYLIIIGGTIAAVLNAFPMSELRRLPHLFRLIFRGQRLPDPNDLIDRFMEWAQIARREGLLALEGHLEAIEDPFLKNGMKMVVDGREMEFIRDALEQDLAAMEARHQVGAKIFEQAGTYAPTLGVLGAVVGLIAALSNLDDTTVLGHSIAAAFVATLLGIFTGYVLWHPFANKLRRLSRQEVELKQMMIEGILSIQAGISPSNIEEKLIVYLPAREREKRAERKHA